MGCLIKINFWDSITDCKNSNNDIAYNVSHSVHKSVRIKYKLWNPKIWNISLR